MGEKIWGVPKKKVVKNLGKYGQKNSTLDISWRYMD